MDGYFKSSEKLLRFYHKIAEKKESDDLEMLKLFLNKNTAVLEQTESELFQIVSELSSSQIHAMIKEIRNCRTEFTDMLDDLLEPLNILIAGDYNKEIFIERLCGFKGNQFESSKTLYRAALYDDVCQLEKNGHVVQNEPSDDSNELIAINHEKRDIINNNYQLLKEKYLGQELPLQELDVLHQMALSEFGEEMDCITYFLNKELLKKYTFVDEKSEYDLAFHQYDGVLFMIDPNQLHFQQNETLMEYLKSKKSIGILENSNLLDEAKRSYKNILDKIVVISNNDTMEELIQVMDNCYFKQASYIKRNTKRYYGQVLYDAIQKMIFNLIKELRMNEEKRKLLSSEFREAIEQEKRSVKVRVDWVITNYEIKTRNNIENSGKLLLDFKGSFSEIQSYVEKEILCLDELSTEFERLKDKIMKSMTKFYMKHSDEIVFRRYEHLKEDYIDFLNTDEKTSSKLLMKEFEFNPKIERSHLGLFNLIELNSKLAEVFDKPGFMLPFAKKKKIMLIQSEIQKTADVNITDIKHKLYQEIENILNASFEEIFSNIDRSFQNIYCSPGAISQGIRSLENLKKEMSTPPPEKTIKELIATKA